MLTDLGLCYSINSGSIGEIYQSTDYLEKLMKVTERTSNSLPVVNAQGSGKKSGMKLVLDWQSDR